MRHHGLRRDAERASSSQIRHYCDRPPSGRVSRSTARLSWRRTAAKRGLERCGSSARPCRPCATTRCGSRRERRARPARSSTLCSRREGFTWVSEAKVLAVLAGGSGRRAGATARIRQREPCDVEVGPSRDRRESRVPGPPGGRGSGRRRPCGRARRSSARQSVAIPPGRPCLRVTLVAETKTDDDLTRSALDAGTTLTVGRAAAPS
jgi:hypothetical protein